MARLDLVLGLIKAGLNGDRERVRTYATSVMAEDPLPVNTFIDEGGNLF